jgi:hypothetical protein
MACNAKYSIVYIFFMTRHKKTDIIKKLLILFNVKPSPTEETKIFKKIKQQQQELDDAFQ